MAMPRSLPRDGEVFVVATGTRRMAAHETGSLEALSRRIARLLGRRYGGLHSLESLAGRPHAGAFHVPDDTLDADQARALGITGAGDLFGGVGCARSRPPAWVAYA